MEVMSGVSRRAEGNVQQLRMRYDIMRSRGKRRTGQPNTTWTRNVTTNSSRRKKNGKDLFVLWRHEIWVNTYMYQGWRTIIQKLWVSQNFSRSSRVWQSPFLAVMCVFLYEAGSASRFSARLRVSKSRFVRLSFLTSRHFIVNFNEATCNF